MFVPRIPENMFMLRRCFVQGSSGHVCQDHSLGERLQAGYSDSFFLAKVELELMEWVKMWMFFWQTPCLFGSCFVIGGMQKTPPQKDLKKNAILRPGFPFFGGWTSTGRPSVFRVESVLSQDIGGEYPPDRCACRKWFLDAEQGVNCTCNGFGRSSLVQCRKHFRWWTVTSTWDFPSWNQFALENWWLEVGRQAFSFWAHFPRRTVNIQGVCMISLTDWPPKAAKS